ncbi:hypothetical protein KSP39_PZI022260 [Platanthera zijinensis]|uniref:Uncharacterized protein n=1 Tax=Platanthera zijinensis TaxID=2320716 RepID=A0AAP0AV32_9ASPA
MGRRGEMDPVGAGERGNVQREDPLFGSPGGRLGCWNLGSRRLYGRKKTNGRDNRGLRVKEVGEMENWSGGMWIFSRLEDRAGRNEGWEAG